MESVGMTGLFKEEGFTTSDPASDTDRLRQELGDFGFQRVTALQGYIEGAHRIDPEVLIIESFSDVLALIAEATPEDMTVEQKMEAVRQISEYVANPKNYLPEDIRWKLISQILFNEDYRKYLAEEPGLKTQMREWNPFPEVEMDLVKPYEDKEQDIVLRKDIRDRFKPVPLTQTSRPNVYERIVIEDINEVIRSNKIAALNGDVLPRSLKFLFTCQKDIGETRMRVILNQITNIISKNIADHSTQETLLKKWIISGEV